MEERDLPVVWTRCLLGDVVDYGKTYKAEPSTIPDQAWVLELEDIEKDSSRLLERLSFAERKSKSTKNVFNTGDVLYGKLRPYLNKVILADRQGFCSTEIIPLPPGEALESAYLFYWLKSPVAVRKDDVSAAIHAAVANVAGLGSISGGGGLIQTTSG